MDKYSHILAKSVENGGTTLKSHLESVAEFAELAARHAGLDVETARIGGLLHDIGKTSPLFQKQLHSRCSPMGLSFRHEIASLFFLPLIERDFWGPVTDMIIAHHKSINKDAKEVGILDLEEYYGEDILQYHLSDFDLWAPDALGILHELNFPGITSNTVLSKEEAIGAYCFVVDYCRQRSKGWSVWKGLLVGSDHIASALGDFTKGVPTLFTTPDVRFYNRKNELFPLSLIDSDLSKKHTFVKAPTGAGKTDFLIKRCRGRIFYTLPFQASINAMYERICHDVGDHVDDIRLLHSISQLQIDEDKLTERLIQDKFGAAIKVLTPHQLAAIAFGVKGYEAILFDLQGSDIILDEIHTYSDIMQSIVLKIVEILNKLDCRVHIGTATMPSTLEHDILDILEDGQVQYVQLPDSVLDSFNRHVVYKAESLDSLLPVIQQSVDNEQKILIVCNRVANAQSFFGRMDELYPDIQKMLIHSRFKREDRNRLEKELKEVYNTNPKACIVVATQVVEVSLDISFDIMMTETAPIDALIQRFGRINRKRTKETIGKYKPVYIITPPTNELDCLPYSAEILKRSYDVLPDGGALLRETELQSLIDKVYPTVQKWELLDAVFREGKWRLKELRHLSKSAFLEKLNIDSVVCITQEDEETGRYREANKEGRILMEIPVRYNSLRWKKLARSSIGSCPFIIPDMAYSSITGLNFSKIGAEYYDTNYQLL